MGSRKPPSPTSGCQIMGGGSCQNNTRGQAMATIQEVKQGTAIVEGRQRKIKGLKLNDLDRTWSPVQGGRTSIKRGQRVVSDSPLSISPPLLPRDEGKAQWNSPSQIKLGRAEKEGKRKRWSTCLIEIICFTGSFPAGIGGNLHI